MDADRINGISRTVIGKAFVVSNTLGVGFLEKIYENALAFELREVGLEVRQQHQIAVHYHGMVIGAYTADLLVEAAILVELKAVRALEASHRAQCLNYLKATRLSLCLLLNFGQPRIEIMRLVNRV
jgi:GxxExxY protein